MILYEICELKRAFEGKNLMSVMMRIIQGKLPTLSAERGDLGPIFIKYVLALIKFHHHNYYTLLFSIFLLRKRWKKPSLLIFMIFHLVNGYWLMVMLTSDYTTSIGNGSLPVQNFNSSAHFPSGC